MIEKPTMAMLDKEFASQDVKFDTPLLHRLYQKNSKRGHAGIVSLLAALAATRVSAAASELDNNAEDFLSGLTTVDDLTAFGENCLPGQSFQAYADVAHDHDAEFAGRTHSEHAAHKNYLDDPFASRFDSPFSNGHGAHSDTHSGHVTNNIMAMTDHSEHISAVGTGSMHAGHENHQGHQTMSAHGAHNNVEHAGHSENEYAAVKTAHGSHHSNGEAAHHESNHVDHDTHAGGAHENHTSGSEHSQGHGHKMENMQVANGDDATSAGHGAHADDDHSQLSVDQSTTIAGVFYSETTDQASHGEHVSTMSHDLAHALMAQATSPDAEMHSLQPEI